MDFGFVNDYYYLTIVNLLMSTVLGLMMGMERERRGISAGLRTFALICVGSALFATLAMTRFSDDSGARIIAQIITGVGFIGAGLIWKQETGVVRGVTTAADIWVAAGVGTAVGSGMYFLAIACTIMVIIILKIHTKNDKNEAQHKQ